MNRPIRRFSLLLLALSAVGCANDEGYDRQALLETLVDDIFLPSYADFTSATGELEEASMAFCADPTPVSLGRLQAAWRATRVSYNLTDAHVLGPQLEYPWRIEPTVDGIARPDNIEAVLLDVTPIDAAEVALLGATQKGMHGVEYLIFDPVGGDALILAAFEDAAGGPRRCDYLLAMSADLSTQSEALETAWVPTGDDYRALLVEAGVTDGPYEDAHDAVAGIVNQMIRSTEIAADTWLGTPAGKEGQAIDASLAESPYSDHSVADLHATLDGLEAVYRGSHDTSSAEASLQDWVRGENVDADARVGEAFAGARQAIDALLPSLSEAILTDAQAVIDACLAFDALRRSMEDDIAAQLDLPLTFSGDGD